MLKFSPAIPVIMLFTAAVGAGLLLAKCSPGYYRTGSEPSSHFPTQKPVDQPLWNNSVPTVRVRLTSNSISSAKFKPTSAFKIFSNGIPDFSSKTGLWKPRKISRRNGVWHYANQRIMGNTLEIRTKNRAPIEFNGKPYRGKIVLVANGANRFYVHNHVNLESYVASVIACELYGSFHFQTFKAQAIAARTYALFELRRRNKNATFDVWATQRSQVYRGKSVESKKSRAATRATSAQVLTYNGKIFLSQYSACNGGYVNSADVLRTISHVIPPLKGGQIDGDGRACPYYTWPTVRIPKSSVFRALAKNYSTIARMGKLAKIRVKNYTKNGRPFKVEVISARGKVRVLRADDLRLALLRGGVRNSSKIRSMDCTLRDTGRYIEFANGRGFGHGVGMSQWGADEKAQRGMTAENILNFYYPQSIITRAYPATR